MGKAEHINRVNNSLHAEEELVRRLPEIDAIYDEEIRAATIRAFLDGCPDYFWERPTSSTGKHHSADECGKHGNWLHTKRVFAKYCDLSESYVEADQMTAAEREAGKSAALLHDMMKYGWPSEGREHTTSEHDVIAADVVKHIGGVSDEVHDLINSHMGPWGEGPLPENDRQWLFHYADKAAAATSEDDLAVYHPSEELEEELADLKVIDHDEGDFL